MSYCVNTLSSKTAQFPALISPSVKYSKVDFLLSIAMEWASVCLLACLCVFLCMCFAIVDKVDVQTKELRNRRRHFIAAWFSTPFSLL